MKLFLNRTALGADGCFGEIMDSKGNFLFVSLEHSYKNLSGDFVTKIPNGTYTCVRGTHYLEHKNDKGETKILELETFEVMGVKGHTGILFHVGNYNRDSKGCILLGMGLGWQTNKTRMIMNSRVAFAQFMKLQDGLKEFELVIT